jgi:SAM-dependent methyltransferase
MRPRARTEPAVDRLAPERRDAFNRDAAAYTAGRPTYPEAVYAFMERIGALHNGACILEIGPGTGQATMELLHRGATVEAVELGPDLAAQLRTRVPDGNLEITVGDVHTLSLPEGAYDAVVAATSFHWVDAHRLLPRLASALRPDGWLVVWWSVFGDPGVMTPFRARVDRIFRETLPSEWNDPREIPRALRVDERLQELTDGGWFGDARHEIVRWTHRMDAAGTRALFSTFPGIANLPPDARDAFLAALAAAVEAEGGVIDDPFVTVVYAARKQPKPHGEDTLP